MREPIAIGFYPEDKEKLIDLIEKCFMHEFGPKKREKLPIIAAIVPHAGYVYSGACASHVYSSIYGDRFVIAGPNHHGLGYRIALSSVDWSTPLGVVKVDEEMLKRMLELEFVKIDESAHRYEHSIEVQLPFLQYYVKEFTFLPICIKHAEFEELKEMAKRIGDAICLASSDFCHCGPAYGFIANKDEAREYDMKAIRYILRCDTRRFLRYVEENGLTICGAYAIALAMEYAKLKNARGKLLCYYNSGDVTGDYSNFVGYAAIVFLK